MELPALSSEVPVHGTVYEGIDGATQLQLKRDGKIPMLCEDIFLAFDIDEIHNVNWKLTRCKAEQNHC